MPRKLSIYLGMVGALLYSISSLMKWYSETIMWNAKIYLDEVVKFASIVHIYYPSVFSLACILIGFFFLNFCWEFAPKKVKIVSTLYEYIENNNQKPNIYSTIFKFIGIITIILGFIVAVFIWSDGIDLPKDKESVFWFGLLPFIYALVGGLTFMGFGEIINLLQQIRDKK